MDNDKLRFCCCKFTHSILFGNKSVALYKNIFTTIKLSMLDKAKIYDKCVCLQHETNAEKVKRNLKFK